MKTIRIGCGSGGCTYERMEPAIELVEKGNIDYLIFECLSERTIADAQRQKNSNPQKGYNPMLQERMITFLPLIKKYKFKIVSNMGGANPQMAIEEIRKIAHTLNIKGLKIAMVTGDDITDQLDMFKDVSLIESHQPISNIKNIISANVYLGSEAICKALDDGADIVITGRVADPSLFVGPILHEFKWEKTDKEKIGQAILTGHLMECCAQLTGGYYADPGYKDVPDLHRLGHPIAEINELGQVFFTKPQGSGGLVDIDICKEQLLYEISDPSCYITPDGVADFSNVRFLQTGENQVAAYGAYSHGLTDTYKVNLAYMDGYLGLGEVSFGGRNSLARAQLAADIIKKRWEIIGIRPLSFQFDYIGFNSLYKTKISSNLSTAEPPEIRLRVAVHTNTEREATLLIREVQCMYINGPAGSSGIASHIEPILAIENFLVPRKAITYHCTYTEV